ncbi:MAG: PAC2 family protein [bacterium]|nr:PAC2 family protein [bacterium]
MADVVNLWDKPRSENLYMIVGWRQWADGGSISSGLPQYLVQQSNARKIGELRGDGFYLFQIPGTHDLVRPVVKFQDGFPKSLESKRNFFYYTGDEQLGVVIFLGDEPHMDVERYVGGILDAAEKLGVKRIITLGGVYGELPYDKERSIGGIYSLRHMKDEMEKYAVNLSDYHGGASIGSYLCRRGGDRGMEVVGFYAFVPTYDLSSFTQRSSSIRIENDFTAWLGVMRRVNHMFKTRFSLVDLEAKDKQLMQAISDKVDELEDGDPQVGIRDYMNRLSDAFSETTFDPLGDVWEEELRRLFDGGGSSAESDEE